MFLGFPCGLAGKESIRTARDWVPSLGWEDPLKKGKAEGGKVCMLVKELEKAKMVEKGSEQGGEAAGPGHSVL